MSEIKCPVRVEDRKNTIFDSTDFWSIVDADGEEICTTDTKQLAHRIATALNDQEKMREFEDHLIQFANNSIDENINYIQDNVKRLLAKYNYHDRIEDLEVVDLMTGEVESLTRRRIRRNRPRKSL